MMQATDLCGKKRVKYLMRRTDLQYLKRFTSEPEQKESQTWAR